MYLYEFLHSKMYSETGSSAARNVRCQEKQTTEGGQGGQKTAGLSASEAMRGGMDVVREYKAEENSSV